MDLKKLNHAIVLAEEGSFARASNRLHLSQPALSRSIQTLEGYLGVKLFDRHPSGIWLTVPGKTLLARAEELLRSASGLRREAELIQGVKHGILSIGLGPVPSQMLLPAFVGRLFEESPRIKVHSIIQHRAYLLEALLRESIELFVSHIHKLDQHTNVVVEPVGSLKLGFFVRKAHPLADQKTITLDDLYDFPLASHTLDESRGDYKQVTQKVLDGWPGLLTCENILVLKSAALTSSTILMTAFALIEEELNTGDLISLPTDPLGLSPYTELGIVHLADRSLSPLASHVVETIRHHMSLNA